MINISFFFPYLKMENLEYYWAEKAFLDFGIVPNLFYLIPASNNQERYNILSQGVENGLVMASRNGILPLIFFFLQKGAKNYDKAASAADSIA